MSDPETLAREAAGDSVTPERLVGDADGFPNLGPYLQSGQEPQHVIPLARRGTALGVGIVYDEDVSALAGYPESAVVQQTRLEASGEAVAVLTWNELLAVVGDALYELPYGTMCGVLLDGNRLEVNSLGARDVVFDLAEDADRSAVRAAVGHLRTAIRRHRSDDR